jgi:excinuclease UvrABC nuclease subunit
MSSENILLIDGGKEQFSAARDALESLGVDPPCVISLTTPQAVGRTVTSAT